MKVNVVFEEECEVYLDSKKICKKYNLDPLDFDGVDGRALHLEKNGVSRFVIFLSCIDSRTIAHESSHIADYVAEHLDIKDDEFRAYVVGHMVGQITRKLKEKE
jgi:hypothetical protein